MRYGKNAVGTGELEHTRRYGELLNTAVGQKDLEDYATSDLRTLASLARALAARAEQGIASRKPSFPSSLPPQLVLSWLPLRAAVVRPRDSWRPAVGESASALCYNRGPWGSRHRRTRESPDTDSLLGDFYLA